MAHYPSSKYYKRIVESITVIIVMVHVLLIGKYATNIPYADDFDAVLLFMTKFLEADSLLAKINLMFSQHNEHRIVLDRVAVLAEWFLLKEVNFRYLLFFGNALLLALFVLLYFTFRRNRTHPSLYFLVIPFLLFNLKSMDVCFSPMASIANFGGIFFSITSMFLLFNLDQSKLAYAQRFYLALISAIIAAFSIGNGLLTLLLCLLGLILKNTPTKYLVIWSIVSSLALLIYFKDYHSVQGHPDVIATILTKPDQLISHFFILLGNAFGLHSFADYPLTLAAGFVVFLFFLYCLLLQDIYKQHLFYTSVLIYLVLSCAMTSLSRAGFGATQALASRYQIYSSLTFIFLYLVILHSSFFSEKIVKVMGFIFFIFFVSNYLIAGYSDQKAIADRCENLNSGASSFYSKTITTSLAYPDQVAATIILARSWDLNVYKLPMAGGEPEFKPYQYYSRDLLKSNDGIEYNLEKIEQTNHTLLLMGWAFAYQNHSKQCQTFVVLQSEKKSLIYPCQIILRTDVSAYFKADLDNSGFKTVILNSAVGTKQNFKVGFMIKCDEGSLIRFTDKVVTLGGEIL
jgi:hypothetical protein